MSFQLIPLPLLPGYIGCPLCRAAYPAGTQHKCGWTLIKSTVRTVEKGMDRSYSPTVRTVEKGMDRSYSPTVRTVEKGMDRSYSPTVRTVEKGMDRSYSPTVRTVEKALVGCYHCGTTREGIHSCPKNRSVPVARGNFVVRKHFNFCPECQDVLNNDAAGYVCHRCPFYHAHRE